MHLILTGATGLIGSHLCRRLKEDDVKLTVLVRSPSKARARLPEAEIVEWEATQGAVPTEVVAGADAVVNLAGESIAGGRWTPERKKRIRDSRVVGTRHLVEGMLEADPAPPVLISGSAIGYYGRTGEEKLVENSPPGSDFLGRVCQDWEAEALQASQAGVRVVLLRTGMVLSPQGGALSEIVRPFKFFVGGPMGSGSQYMSWIHLQDHLDMIQFALQREGIQGPLNATAPNPVRNREFVQVLGQTIGRPSIVPAPGFALKALFGEMAESLLLEGQRVLPQKALNHGFEFRYPHLREALENLL